MAQGELICGIHAVGAALARRPGQIHQIWLRRRPGKRLKVLVQQARDLGVPVQEAPPPVLNEMLPGISHQGIVARVAPAQPLPEDALYELLADVAAPSPLVLVLDGVQDPHNLGACLRTADAAGVHAVVAPKDRAVGFTQVVRKVASGAAETMPFVQVTNLARTLRALQAQGLWVTGADADSETSFYSLDLTGPTALVLGAEGSGMRRLTRAHCDFIGYLPMAGTVASLNVAVTAGVCLFEAVRQRVIAQASSVQ